MPSQERVKKGVESERKIAALNHQMEEGLVRDEALTALGRTWDESAKRICVQSRRKTAGSTCLAQTSRHWLPLSGPNPV